MKKNLVNFITYTIVILLFVIVVLFFGMIIRFLGNKVFGASKIITEDYIVQAGDTLWDIASEYKKDGQDIREYVSQLRELNNIDNCIIVPGQTIQIIK